MRALYRRQQGHRRRAGEVVRARRVGPHRSYCSAGQPDTRSIDVEASRNSKNNIDVQLSATSDNDGGDDENLNAIVTNKIVHMVVDSNYSNLSLVKCRTVGDDTKWGGGKLICVDRLHWGNGDPSVRRILRGERGIGKETSFQFAYSHELMTGMLDNCVNRGQ
eukprot:7413808-Pyramimonas_sp.AAC.1